MSCSLWAYAPNKCDGDYCCGDCDQCNKAEMEVDEDERSEQTGRFL